MKAAIKAINEDNADNLTAALASIEDVNAVSSLFMEFFCILINALSCISLQKNSPFRYQKFFSPKVQILTS
jgi:hypothetical protein